MVVDRLVLGVVQILDLGRDLVLVDHWFQKRGDREADGAGEREASADNRQPREAIPCARASGSLARLMLWVVFAALLRPGCGGQFVVLLLRLPFPVGLNEEAIDQEDGAGDQERHDEGNRCAQRRHVRERDKHCGAVANSTKKNAIESETPRCWTKI